MLAAFADCSSDVTGSAEDSRPCPCEGPILIETRGSREYKKVTEAPKDPHRAREPVGGVKDAPGALNQGSKEERFRLGRVRLEVERARTSVLEDPVQEGQKSMPGVGNAQHCPVQQLTPKLSRADSPRSESARRLPRKPEPDDGHDARRGLQAAVPAGTHHCCSAHGDRCVLRELART